MVYLEMKRCRIAECIIKIFKFILSFIGALLSFDLHMANIQKKKLNAPNKQNDKGEATVKANIPNVTNAENIENNNAVENDSATSAIDTPDMARGKLIVFCNWFNLFLSLVLVVVAFIAVCVKCDVFMYVMFGVISYRILSRTIEINVSFVKDICTRAANKKSNLDKYDRIRLAIKSLIEEALLFAAMYAFLTKGDCNILQCLIGGLHSFTIDVYAAENVQVWSSDWLKLVAVWQKFCSGILVTLCIAQYFAGEDKK